MGKSGKKPRSKMDPKKHEETSGGQKKREEDWSFDDIARSKTKRR